MSTTEEEGNRPWLSASQIKGSANETLRNVRQDRPFSFVLASIGEMGEGFAIDKNLSIMIPNVHIFQRLDIPDERTFGTLMDGALRHELMHALAFPFMTRADDFYAVVYRYAKDRNLQWQPGLVNRVENYLSDVLNELIAYTHGIAPSLPTTRFIYVVKPNAEELANPSQDVLRNPILRLFLVHNKVFTSIYEGKLSRPRVPKPADAFEVIYNRLSEVAEKFDVEAHVVDVQYGSLLSRLGETVRGGLFDAADRLYEVFKSVSEGKDPGVSDKDIEGMLTGRKLGSKNEEAYWAYFAVLLAFYRWALDELQENPNAVLAVALPNVDSGSSLPEVESEGEGKKGKEGNAPVISVGDVVGKAAALNFTPDSLMPPELADWAARRLLRQALGIAQPTTSVRAEAHTYVMRYSYPENPGGELDEESIATYEAVKRFTGVGRALDELQVSTPTSIVTLRRSEEPSSSVSPPKFVTIVIDESGSTGGVTNILVPLVGVQTWVYDVERVTAMAILYRLKELNPSTPTVLVRFSTETRTVTGTAESIYEYLKNINNEKLMLGGTEASLGVDEGIKYHADNDSARSYFLFMSDMLLYGEDAERVRDYIEDRIPNSRVLIMALNNPLPDVLAELNRQRRVAAVSVSSIDDYKKVERAIRKLLRARY